MQTVETSPSVMAKTMNWPWPWLQQTLCGYDANYFVSGYKKDGEIKWNQANYFVSGYKMDSEISVNQCNLPISKSKKNQWEKSEKTMWFPMAHGPTNSTRRLSMNSIVFCLASCHGKSKGFTRKKWMLRKENRETYGWKKHGTWGKRWKKCILTMETRENVV